MHSLSSEIFSCLFPQGCALLWDLQGLTWAGRIPYFFRSIELFGLVFHRDTERIQFQFQILTFSWRVKAYIYGAKSLAILSVNLLSFTGKAVNCLHYYKEILQSSLNMLKKEPINSGILAFSAGYKDLVGAESEPTAPIAENRNQNLFWNWFWE